MSKVAPEWTTGGEIHSPERCFIMTLAQKLKFVRKELDFSQRQIAQLLKTNQTMICLMDRGYVPVTHQQAITELENLYEFLKGEQK